MLHATRYMHTPVLLKEVIEVLNPQPGEFFIDGTVGSGGHAVEIFKRVMPTGRILGIDLDKNNLEIARLKISTELRIKNLELRNDLILIQGNYANLPEILKNENLPKADGLLLDLGFSSESLASGRGFTFQKNEPLDMRYNEATRDKRQETGMTAAEIINSFSEKDLADIFWKYGEERLSRKIAKKIVTERKTKPIITTFDLVNVILSNSSRMKPNESPIFERHSRKFEDYSRKYRIHPATRVFQALRIYVNDELGNLERLLKNLPTIIKIKGRVAIISFHSLEDRLVKNYFREMAKNGQAEILTKKPIRPSEEEVKINTRSRSAKMRAIIMKY